MKRILLVSLLFVTGLPAGLVRCAAAEPQFSVVFDGQEGKYEVVRTPQLLVAKAGTLLALAQGRSGNHDRSDNDIILKRSADGGATWSKFQVEVREISGPQK